MFIKSESPMRYLLTAVCVLMVAVVLVCVGGAFEVDAATYSGSCGDNVSWTLNTDTGVLEIFGEGKMEDYDFPILRGILIAVTLKLL